MSGPSVQIEGLEEAMAALQSLAPKEAKNLIRQTVTDLTKEGAGIVSGLVPQDDGALRAGIEAKRARPRGWVIWGRITSKAFYWRFLEHGQGPDGVEHAFVLRTMKRMESGVLSQFLRVFGQRFEKAMARKARRGG